VRSAQAEPAGTAGTVPSLPGVLVLGCGALAHELLELVERNGLAGAVDVRCLSANLHNRPEHAPAVEAKLAELGGRYEHVFVAYADCGTGGALDEVLAKRGAVRLPGAHCDAAYEGVAELAALAAEEPGTFYLTDCLARSFDALVVRGLRLDRHPELVPVYFAGYPAARLPLTARGPEAARDGPTGRLAPRPGLRAPAGRL
jgi:hypothetical protein